MNMFVGLCKRLSIIMCYLPKNALNFTYSVSRPKDNNLGDLLPDGTWTGIIGSLRRKEVDVGKLSIQQKRNIYNISKLCSRGWCL